MSKLVLYMSMSVDGFITGPDDGMDTDSALTTLHSASVPYACPRRTQMAALIADLFLSVDGYARGSRSPGYFGFAGPDLEG
jgi:hypothetical protein